MEFTHAIMFHHFHDDKHPPAQGSLSAKDFEKILDWLFDRYNLMGAQDYLKKFEQSELASNDICLSFDDALLCQYDIAVPILNKRKIDAFFFVYSSVFEGKPDDFEIFRYFRNNCFENIDEFYEEFFNIIDTKYGDFLLQYLQEYKKLNYLSSFPYYTENDKWFRFLRDEVLGRNRYSEIMTEMITKSKFNSNAVLADLWMSEDNIRDIAENGHTIGLHSFSHPMKMSNLDREKQQQEYQKNYTHLSAIVGDIVSMSHPCGDYNNDTLKILDQLGIRIGFRDNLSTTIIKGKFEVPRNDHVMILKEMNR